MTLATKEMGEVKHAAVVGGLDGEDGDKRGGVGREQGIIFP